MSSNDQPISEPGGNLGTFGGVFTPSILTILGLVLFLRVGFVLGSVGLVQTLIILALATSVSILTSISLAVMATNMKVRGGGEYFLISRTLGIEFGGAVGLVLYTAISVSIAFYAIGFAEAFVTALGSQSGVLIQLVAAGLVLLMTAISFIGSDLATRLQYLVMILLIVALGSFFIGAIDLFDAGQLSDNIGSPSSEVGFWEAFAIFFPAVTGFSQGVAMSGDLRSPSKSITRGTFTAVGVSTVVYIVVIVLLAGSASAADLADRTTTIMGDLSLVSWTMLVGVLAATLSSALASTLGGPRVLQQLGDDRVLPRLESMAIGYGPSNNPRRALFVSMFIALLTVAAGDLNTIAPVISMFFLATYGMINYATYYEIRAGGTSFRPSFRFGNRGASLAGAVACLVAIVAINPLAGFLAALVLVALYSYLRNRDTPERWVNSSATHHYTQARQHLRSLSQTTADARNWRPCILAFVPRDPTNRRRMIAVASWLEGESGFITAVRVLRGSGPRLRQQTREVERELAYEAAEIAEGAYGRAVLVEPNQSGVQSLVQSFGIGDVRPNLTLFGIRDLRGSERERLKYGSMLQDSVRFGTNVAVVNVRDDAWEKFERTAPSDRVVALWWSDNQVGQLITLLGYLCQRHAEWSDAQIIVYVPDSDEHASHERVSAILDDARISATVESVDETPAAFTTALAGATLALAPLRVRRGVALGPFDTPLGMLAESLPLAALILATESVDLDVEPDAGDLAELARVTDQAADAKRWVDELDAEAARLLVEAEALRIDLAGSSPTATQAQLDETESAAKAAYRTYVDARTRYATLEARVDELTPETSNSEVDPAIWRSASAQTTESN